MKSKASGFTSFLFVLPYLIMFTLFLVIPLVYGIYISFHDWNLISPIHPFIGLENYSAIFTSGSPENRVFLNGLKNTAQFVIYSVPLLVIIGLGLAMLVNSLPEKIRGFFRTAYFLPFAISVSVIAVLWLWMLDSNSGLVNQFINSLGMDSIPWLTRLPFAWISLVIATVWWTIGFNMIIFINALNEVSEELYEAADIDGASSWHKFLHITLPSIRPIMIFVVITSTIASFNVYGQPYLMTRGGPGESTEVLLMGIVQQAFQLRQMGSAAAMAMLMALIMIVISVGQFLVTRSGERKEKNHA
ncbi:binding-protein-dependent transport system inner membrane component [Jeotgalibacillus malaysiensis]|uniref:Binding-protein-dependent transport system inner membrane component n=1 Tax=Jeotgalibacillus malaysiensis TaxID=1508404 RepID=A0A0B5AQI7_9BACL|nr:sugar ABC transporter permease [Jeotgalibacillus malaysiensis]AJD92346.1 binding-protein-dependent transport system inner membrane component [Jeotgalibacillus malaysiensis]